MGRSMYKLFPRVVVTMVLMKVLLARGADLNLICPKTNDPALCMKLLGADRRTPSADLAGLGQITISMAGNSATGTKFRLQSLIGSEKDPQIQACLDSCNKYYANAISVATGAAKDLKSRDYLNLSLGADQIIDDAVGCEAGFQQNKKPSPLTNENHVLACLGSILEVITDLSRR